MIPEVGFSEMIIIGIVALLVVGPKDLPMLLRKLGEWTRKLRNMATDFRHSFDELARQSELDDLRKEVDALRQLNPMNDIRDSIANAASLGENYLNAPNEPQYQFDETENVPLVNEAPSDNNEVDTSAPATVAKVKKPRKPRAKKTVDAS